MATVGFDWTEEAVTSLRALWADGKTTAEIGRRLGITKSAVIGKAGRLNLTRRPNPIPGAKAAKPKPPKPEGWQAKRRRAARERKLAVERVAVVARATERRMSRDGCRFPIGDPKRDGFRFCDEPAPLGKPYCDHHHAVCYRTVHAGDADA